MSKNIVEAIKTHRMNLSSDDVKYHGVYCFHAISSESGGIIKDLQGNIVYIPLGRNNKPLRVGSQNFVDYADYIETHGMVFNIDPRKMGNVWDPQLSEVKLYVHDDCVPESRRDYAKHMNVIMSYAEPYNAVRH